MSVVTYLHYTLTLQSPAILHGLLSDPNTVCTLRYIPGSMLRGVVARVLGDPENDSTKQIEFKQLVLGGNVEWLNAWPIVKGERTLPMPTSYRQQKQASGEKENETFDLMRYDGTPGKDHCVAGHWPEERLKGCGEKFLAFTASTLGGPSVKGRLHQQRHRPQGRAWTDRSGGGEVAKGTVYAYESLDKGQSFKGCVKIAADTQAEVDRLEARVKKLLQDEPHAGLLLGRSRRAEYGGDAEIKFGEATTTEWNLSGATTQITAELKAGDCFVVMTTSTCIVRDPLTGQVDPAALCKVLCEKLGANAVEDVVDDGGRSKRLAVSFEKVGGFNRKWRLELPQTLGVRAGSMVLLRAKQAIEIERLKELEDRGIGDRRSEGFGRFVFLSQASGPEPFKLRSLEKEGSIEVSLTSPPPALVTQLEARLVTAVVNKQIDVRVGELLAESSRKADRPTNSLLGRLREPLRNQDTEDAARAAIQTLRTWLNDDETNSEQLKRPAMDQLRKRCIKNTGAGPLNNQSLGEWLKAVLGEQDLRRLLNLQDSTLQSCRLISNETVATAINGMTHQLKVRLIDAVLSNLAILNRRKETSPS